ncbi:MAG TPA: hypothetical protein V6D10_07165 [Trichocoleus sp.]|jgi:hypothetical protein
MAQTYGRIAGGKFVKNWEAREAIAHGLQVFSKAGVSIEELELSLFDYRLSGRIAMHSNRSLVELPLEQTWTIDFGNHEFYLESGSHQIQVAVTSLETFAEDRIAAVVELLFYRSVEIVGDRLFVDGIPVLGEVLESHMQAGYDCPCEWIVRLRVPVTSGMVERGENYCRYILRVSEVEHQRIARHSSTFSLHRSHMVPPSSPKACQGCKHFYGRSHNGEQGTNLLVCAMYPYGPDGDECEDWEKKEIQDTGFLRQSQALAGVDSDGNPYYVDVLTFGE